MKMLWMKSPAGCDRVWTRLALHPKVSTFITLAELVIDFPDACHYCAWVLRTDVSVKVRHLLSKLPFDSASLEPVGSIWIIPRSLTIQEAHDGSFFHT